MSEQRMNLSCLAIAAGMFHQSMKDKMDELEIKKASLTIKLEEAKLQAQIHTPTEEMIRRYPEKDADIRNKSPEDQRRIIQTYVNKVIVYEDRIDIDKIVTFVVEANHTGLNPQYQ